MVLIRSLYTPRPFRRKRFIRNESLEPLRTTRTTPRITRIIYRSIKTIHIKSPPLGGSHGPGVRSGDPGGGSGGPGGGSGGPGGGSTASSTTASSTTAASTTASRPFKAPLKLLLVLKDLIRSL